MLFLVHGTILFVFGETVFYIVHTKVIGKLI